MRYLLDSNVLLEVALNRAQAQQAAAFLTATPTTELAICDFSLHSMGFYLIRKTPDLYNEIIADVLNRGITILRLDPAHLAMVTANATKYHLDFDDAFVYTIAELHNLTIISFDQDFDATPRGRTQPDAATHS